MSHTQDAWPGPPKVMPPLLEERDRAFVYGLAFTEGATVAQLAACYADVGQRLAKALHSPPPLAQEECDEAKS